MTFPAPVEVAAETMVAIFWRQFLAGSKQRDYIVQFVFVKMPLACEFKVSEVLMCYFNPVDHGSQDSYRR